MLSTIESIQNFKPVKESFRPQIIIWEDEESYSLGLDPIFISDELEYTTEEFQTKNKFSNTVRESQTINLDKIDREVFENIVERLNGVYELIRKFNAKYTLKLPYIQLHVENGECFYSGYISAINFIFSVPFLLGAKDLEKETEISAKDFRMSGFSFSVCETSFTDIKYKYSISL